MRSSCQSEVWHPRGGPYNWGPTHAPYRYYPSIDRYATTVQYCPRRVRTYWYYCTDRPRFRRDLRSGGATSRNILQVGVEKRLQRTRQGKDSAAGSLIEISVTFAKMPTRVCLRNPSFKAARCNEAAEEHMRRRGRLLRARVYSLEASPKK